jgi:hypothetical protein
MKLPLLFEFIVTLAVVLASTGCATIAPVTNIFGETRPSAPQEIVFFDWMPCSFPIAVYYPMPCQPYQADMLWQGMEQLNQEAGYPLFVNRGILTAPQLLRPWAEDIGQETAVLVQFLPPEAIDEMLARPFSERYSASGFFRTVTTAGCMSTGWIAINSLHEIFPSLVEATVQHEALHALSFDDTYGSGVMNWRLPDLDERPVWPLYNITDLPRISEAELQAVREIYLGISGEER